jgi:hypothetical protein
MYKGFSITERTFQIRGSGRWTLDVLLGRHTRMRAFTSPLTYATREEAIEECCAFGKRIIDGNDEHCSMDDALTQ